MLRISWVHPEVVARVRDVVLGVRKSWDEVFGADDTVGPGEPPTDLSGEGWPRLVEHVARAERVREIVAKAGLPAALARFGESPHAIERAALAEAKDAAEILNEAENARGVLSCAIDELLAYGHFLSRLCELSAASDPSATALVFEGFVERARAVQTFDTSWPERLRVAEDGLASLYVRIGRSDDAEALFARRFDDEPQDVTLAITAARAFLEHGDVARAIRWLERGRERAHGIGRADLATRLGEKATALRKRLS